MLRIVINTVDTSLSLRMLENLTTSWIYKRARWTAGPLLTKLVISFCLKITQVESKWRKRSLGEKCMTMTIINRETQIEASVNLKDLKTWCISLPLSTRVIAIDAVEWKLRLVDPMLQILITIRCPSSRSLNSAVPVTSEWAFVGGKTNSCTARIAWIIRKLKSMPYSGK